MWQKAEKKLLQDKYLGSIVEKYGSCKIEPSKKENYFTDLVETILQQQLSIKAANTILERVRVGLSREVVPEKILSTKDNKFREWGVSGQKTKYLKDLSKKVSREEVKLSNLPHLSDNEVIEELVKVKGIGEWSAHMFLMFSLARPDIFPVGDLGIRKGVKEIIGQDMEPDEMVKFSQRWSPHRTPASWYIWRILENE